MTANFGTNSEPFTGTARFALVREIGAGGMGIVFEAEDKERSSRVALKTLHRLNPSDLYRFKKEFRCLQSLVHPNLVTLYELIADKGHWFLTMELVDGKDFLTYVRDDVDSDGTELESVGTSEHPQPQTWTFAGSDPAMGSSDVTNRSALSTKLDPPLATTIKQAGSPKKEICDNSTRSEGLCPVSVRMQNSTEMAFSLHENGADNLQVSSTPALEGDDPACDMRRLCGLLEQFADALHFLHEAGMLHRDLKPSNVLVTPTGRVVILDFGLVMEVRGESLIGGLETENAAGAGAYSHGTGNRHGADGSGPHRRDGQVYGAGAGRGNAAHTGRRLVQFRRDLVPGAGRRIAVQRYGGPNSRNETNVPGDPAQWAQAGHT